MYLRLLMILSLGLTMMACSDPEVGTKQRPFTMYFIPSVDAESLAKKSKPMEEFLQKSISQKLYGKDDGFYVKSSVPSSYIAVVESLGTKKADFAAFTTFAYVLAADIKKYPVDPMFIIGRGPDGKELTYRSQFIARADSNIKSLEDLKGKKFAYVDPASTSGYILPSAMLKAKSVVPSDIVFAQKHDNVVTMVYQKQVDAGATYWSPAEEVEKNGKQVTEIRDARMRVLTQFPDIEKKVNIIGFSEEVPNEPWVIRTNLYKDEEKNKKVLQAVRDSILEFSLTPEGKEALWTVSTARALVPATKETFARISQMIRDSEVDVNALLMNSEKKKK